MSDYEYKTQRFFFFGKLCLGHQTADNGWGGFSHRIALLGGDCETVVDHGYGADYQHPAIFDIHGRAFTVLTAYHDDDTSVQPEVIYQLLSPPDSKMAMKSVEERGAGMMSVVAKIDLASILGIDDCAGLTKQYLAERVIRLKDRIEALGR